MYMRKLVVAIVTLLVLVELDAQSDSLKNTGSGLFFEQALQQVYENNGGIKASHWEVERAKYEQKVQRGLFLPSIGAMGAYVYMSDPLQIDLNDQKPTLSHTLGQMAQDVPTLAPVISKYGQQLAAKDWKYTLQDNQFFFADATLTWPLFTGGKIMAAQKYAGAQRAEAEIKHEAVRSAVTTELVERYFGYRLSLQVVAIRNQVLQNMKKHVSDAKKLEQNGMLTKAERLHAQVSMAEAERDLMASTNDLQLNGSALKATLGATSDSLLPVSPLFINPLIETLEYYQQLATENNEIIKQLDAKKQMAKAGYMKEVSHYMPDIVAMGRHNLYTWNMWDGVPKTMVGVGFKWTLFDGFARENKVKAALINERMVDSYQQKAQNEIPVLVEKHYVELKKSIEQLQSLETTMEFAREYVQVRQKAFQEGLATSTELVDAELALSKVKIARLQALYAYDVALARLLTVCGRIDLYETYRNLSSTQTENTLIN